MTTAASTYEIIDIIGVSKTSWEDAAQNAIATAGRKLKDLRIAEIIKLDIVVENGKAVVYRARMTLSFKYHGIAIAHVEPVFPKKK